MVTQTAGAPLGCRVELKVDTAARRMDIRFLIGVMFSSYYSPIIIQSPLLWVYLVFTGTNDSISCMSIEGPGAYGLDFGFSFCAVRALSATYLSWNEIRR